MAAAIVAPAEVLVGNLIKITGTGWTSGGNVQISAYAEGQPGGLELRKAVFAATTTTFDTTGILDIAPTSEGHVDITVTDVTAVTTLTARVKVSRRS